MRDKKESAVVVPIVVDTTHFTESAEGHQMLTK